MSGIAGVVYSDQRSAEAATLQSMIEATRILGMDGVRTWREGPVGLIWFALATTPESVSEEQPYTNPRSALTIAFDGRLDNRADLLALLGDAVPKDAPDCQLALGLFELLGDDFVRRLVGDYAFGIWDPRRRRLLCARSPLGWRPFLWTVQDRRLAFASQPSTLVRGLRLDRQLNEGAIAEFLSSKFVTDTETFWKDVQRLPQGHSLSYENGSVRVWRWLIGPFQDHSRLSEAGHVERFNTLFNQALVAVTRSTGPVATHLSGGLDSSAIVCRTRELVRAGKIDRMIEPYSARFPGERCDEGEWIAAVEEHAEVKSHSVIHAHSSLEGAARWCAESMHLPLRPNAETLTSNVCQELRARGGRVLLTGEGGDDWLGGSLAHWPDLLMSGRWSTLLQEGFAVDPEASWAWNIRVVLALSVGPLVSGPRRDRVLWPHLDFNTTPPPWINPDWAARTHLTERWTSAPRVPRAGGFAQAQRYQAYALARRHVNVENSVAYADSQGVELRHPLHDFRLTQFLIGASGGMLRRNGARKHLLREAMRGTLPELVRNRRGKADMSPPIIDAVTARLQTRPFGDLQCVKRGWVDAERLEAHQAAHLAWRLGGAVDGVPSAPYAPVWNAIAIDLWLESAVGL